MSKDFKQIVADVKDAYDIADYIENSGVSLKITGGRAKGLCPFHGEKTPSFVVDSHFQSYRCFGCGENGDIIKFAQEYNSISFMEALTMLAQDKGISLDGVFSSEEDDEEKVDISSLRELLRETGIFFWRLYQKLPNSHIAKTEISGRNLTIENTYNIYGYAPEGGKKLYEHLKNKGFSDDLIETSGVCKKSSKNGKFFDFWQGRLMFIISDITGRVVGFSGRKLYETDKMGKYVNSSDSPIFDKSSVLFNASHAKKVASQKKCIFVVEGQFDVMAMIEANLVNTVASSGTAFTQKQSGSLRRLVGSEGKIIFFFDNDEAGQKAAEKVFEVDPLIHSKAEVVIPPEGMDPNDYGIKYGYDSLNKYVNNERNRVSITEFVLHAIERRQNMDSPEGRSKYVEEASVVLGKISSTSLRREYMKRVALAAHGVPMEVIQEYIDNTSSEKTNQDIQKLENNADTEVEDDRQKHFTVDELVERKANKVIEAMNTTKYHSFVGRLLWLSLNRHDLLKDKVYKIKNNLLPKPYHSIVDELYQIDSDSRIFSERFSDHFIVEDIIKNHKPSDHIVANDDSIVESLFNIIVKQMISDRVRQKRSEKRSQMVGIIGEDDTSAKVLRDVIEEHKREKENVEKIMRSLLQ